MEFTRQQLIELEKELFEKLNAEYIYPEDGTFSLSYEYDLILKLYISGDWKHDHLACDYYVKQFCNEHNFEIVNQDNQVEGESEDDSYEAWHFYDINVKEVDESLNESQSQEIGGFYDKFSKEHNVDLDKLVYGKDGFMKTCYPDGFPDFAGDVIYSEKYWNEFEKWLKDVKGINLDESLNEEKKYVTWAVCYRDPERNDKEIIEFTGTEKQCDKHIEILNKESEAEYGRDNLDTYEYYKKQVTIYESLNEENEDQIDKDNKAAIKLGMLSFSAGINHLAYMIDKYIEGDLAKLKSFDINEFKNWLLKNYPEDDVNNLSKEEISKFIKKNESLNEEMKIAFDRVYTFAVDRYDTDGNLDFKDLIDVACIGSEDGEAILEKLLGKGTFKITDIVAFDNIVNYLLNHNKNNIYNLSDVEKHYGDLDESLNESYTQTQVKEVIRLCNQIGIKTLADLKSFNEENPGDLLTALTNYKNSLGKNFRLPKKERGLYNEGLANGQLMIWTGKNAPEYHAEWIDVPNDITLDDFELLLLNNGYEIHDTDEDQEEYYWFDSQNEHSEHMFAIELGSAARWWQFSSLQACLDWFKAGNRNDFKNCCIETNLDEKARQKNSTFLENSNDSLRRASDLRHNFLIDTSKEADNDIKYHPYSKNAMAYERNAYHLAWDILHKLSLNDVKNIWTEYNFIDYKPEDKAETIIYNALKKRLDSESSEPFIYGSKQKINNSLNEKIKKQDNVEYKGFTIEHFPITWHFGDKEEDIDGWIIHAPGYFVGNDKQFPLPLRCHQSQEDNIDNSINFKTVEEAKAWIDDFGDNYEIAIEHGDEIHAWPKEVNEELVNEENLEETYSDDELDKMVGKVYNIRKITDWYRTDSGLYAHTVCTKCGRDKDVFLSNLVNDPDKYGSCICSDTSIDGKIDYAQSLYTGGRKLSTNTSGYTGVSFVKTYKGQPYNKWRAYIEVDGKRTYLGDFEKKKDAVKARKEAGEKGVKWYKDNRNKLTRDMRRKTKKYKNSKYRDSKRKTINLKVKK